MPTASHPPFKPRTLPEIVFCPTPQAPCCSQANFKSFHTLLTPAMAPHAPSGLTPVCCCHTVPLQFHFLLPFHDLPPGPAVPFPPSPGVAQSGGREETEAVDTANKTV